MTDRFFESPAPIKLPEDTPLVFLEGPVQGAPDWQTPFAHRLLEAFPDIAVASPRALAYHQDNFASANPEVRTRTSERQVAYELLARRLAFRYGAIAMWYAAQDPTIPYPEGRAYGKTTEKEDSEVWGAMVWQPDYPFIVGVDPNYNASAANSRGYIKRNHNLIGITEYTSLDDVFNATAEAVEYTLSVGPRPIPSLTAQSIQRALDQLDSE